MNDNPGTEKIESRKEPTTHIVFNINTLDRMDILIEYGLYSNRNELIKDSVRQLIQKHIDSGLMKEAEKGW